MLQSLNVRGRHTMIHKNGHSKMISNHLYDLILQKYTRSVTGLSEVRGIRRRARRHWIFFFGAGAGRMAGAESRLDWLHNIAHKIGERDGLIQ